MITRDWQVLHSCCPCISGTRSKSLNLFPLAVWRMSGRGACDNHSLTARKLLILNGEMSEWLKAHAWKACSAARRCSISAPTRSSPAPATSLLPQPTGAQLENLNKTGVRLWTDSSLVKTPVEVSGLWWICPPIMLGPGWRQKLG